LHCICRRAEGIGPGLLRGGVNPLQKQEAAHIIDDIGQSDPHGGSGNAHGPDEQSRLRFLIGKDMLDTRPDNGLSGVGPLDMPGHGFEMWLLAMDF